MKNAVYISTVRGRGSRYVLYSYSDFFKVGEDVIVKVKEDCIIFTKPTLSYVGKANKVSAPHYYNNKYYGKSLRFSSTTTIPVLDKNLIFDEEESNEDKVVVYFNKKQEDN